MINQHKTYLDLLRVADKGVQHPEEHAYFGGTF